MNKNLVLLAACLLASPAFAVAETRIVPPDPEHYVTPGPPYPLEAAKQHKGGLVLLRVFFPKAGPPLKVEVQRSSGFAPLDTFAARWALQHYYSRGLTEAPTQPVTVPVNFVLR